MTATTAITDLDIGLRSAQSRFVRPVEPRSLANQWRVACAEAFKNGAVVMEIRTRAAHVGWKPGA
jgi:hypothetical protein